MNPLPRALAKVLLALALFSAPGCDRLFDKGSKDEIAAAEKKAAAGDFRGAVQLYEASLDGTAKTAETHYKLALLYADKLKSPLDAIHHLDRYLELAPTGAHAKDAKSLKKEDENKLLVQLSNGTPSTQAEAVRLKNENQMLLEKLALIRSQKPPPPATLNPKGEPVQNPIPPGARTYTVKAGDTLAKISRQFYKNSARAKDIQDANFNQLSGAVKIKPGMVLLIPK
jgi:nucleoid-associated protein YgaU